MPYEFSTLLVVPVGSRIKFGSDTRFGVLMVNGRQKLSDEFLKSVLQSVSRICILKHGLPGKARQRITDSAGRTITYIYHDVEEFFSTVCSSDPDVILLPKERYTRKQLKEMDGFRRGCPLDRTSLFYRQSPVSRRGKSKGGIAGHVSNERSEKLLTDVILPLITDEDRELSSIVFANKYFEAVTEEYGPTELSSIADQFRKLVGTSVPMKAVSRKSKPFLEYMLDRMKDFDASLSHNRVATALVPELMEKFEYPKTKQKMLEQAKRFVYAIRRGPDERGEYAV